MLENKLHTKKNKNTEDKYTEIENINDIKDKNNIVSNVKEDEIQNIFESNNEQLNNLIEALIRDKDFMDEFLLMEKRNLLLQKKREREFEKTKEIYDKRESEQKEILTNKDFEAIYKELNDNNIKNDQKINKINFIKEKGEEEIKEENSSYGELKKSNGEIDGEKVSYLNENLLDEIGGDMCADEEKEEEEVVNYNRLLKLVKQYGINKILNKLMDILNSSSKGFTNIEDKIIKGEIMDITKNIRKDVLFIYLMKIIANNKNLLFKDNKNKFDKGNLTKKKIDDVDYQYRSRHFHWVQGILYSYAPKNRIRSSKCYLYCGKGGCEAKVQVDMNKKKAILVGSHNNHEGINVNKYIYEYPELDSDGWKHLQYDCYHGKKIFMWKY